MCRDQNRRKKIPTLINSVMAMVLNTLFPNNETRKEVIISSILVGFSVYLLLIIYQPYGTSEFQNDHKYLLLLPYFIFFAICFGSVSAYFRNSRKYTVLTEVCKNILILLASSVFCYFYNSLLLSRVHLSFENYLYMLAYTSALGIPVMIASALGRYIYFNHKANVNNITEISRKVNHDLTDRSDDRILNGDLKNLTITSDYANFSFQLTEENFIYAEAADNYCIIYFYKESNFVKEMIRISLNKLLDQVQTDNIRQIHRSCIVNLKRVNKFKGNASGYKISIKDIDKELTISRNYIPSIVPVLKDIAARP